MSLKIVFISKCFRTMWTNLVLDLFVNSHDMLLDAVVVEAHESTKMAIEFSFLLMNIVFMFDNSGFFVAAVRAISALDFQHVLVARLDMMGKSFFALILNGTMLT